MRRILGLALVLLLAGTAVGEDEPPSEKAVFAATRNLLHTLGTATSSGRDDALVRYVDVAAFASRTFVEAYDALAAEERAQVRATLYKFLFMALYDELPRPKDPDAAELTSQQVEGVYRMVTFRAEKESIEFLWAVAAPAPMLVDLGIPKEGFFSEFLRRMWKKEGSAPRAFLAKMLWAFEKAAKAGKTGEKDQIALIVESKDNLRVLITLMIARRVERVTGGYPPYSGKNFVLSLVATNQLDRRDARNLAVLFSPGDKRLSLEKADKSRYKEINKKALKNKTDFHELTSYAGRRNAEREFLITPSQEKMGTPLIADLSFKDVAIVAFTNGSVREMTRKELGLGPDDPIVVGDESKSELLQKLSDH